MIKFEKVEVTGWDHAIRGMRNSMNSWEKSDSLFGESDVESCADCPYNGSACINDNIVSNCINIGPNDYDLMTRLRNAGTDHRKFMRMITVYVDITAPLYWWKEFDTYKVGTVANSCSTMHKIAAKEFALEDFSCERLADNESVSDDEFMLNDPFWNGYRATPIDMLVFTIKMLNHWRNIYLETKSKRAWWQMIQLLPSSYNQKRTVMMNYEVLANIYKSRKDHKLDEWAEHKTKLPKELVKACNDALIDVKEGGNGMFGFCDWIQTLPYSELITGKED